MFYFSNSDNKIECIDKEEDYVEKQIVDKNMKLCLGLVFVFNGISTFGII